jgi:hypothetical protein
MVPLACLGFELALARRRVQFIMRNRVIAAKAAAWLLGGATLAVSGQAFAQATPPPACPALTATTVVVSGSSAFKPVLAAVGTVLGSSVTLIYYGPGSCEGLDHVLQSPAPKDTDTSATLIQGSTVSTCTPPAAGLAVDVGFSDVYPATCAATFDMSLPAVGTGTADFLGPVQAMTFAVPTASSENTISAEAAYMVFGFDAATGDQVMPFVTPNDIYVRFWDSGTLEMLGKAINLPGGKWKNATNASSTQTAGGTGGMQTDILTSGGMSGHVNSTIGILSTSGLKTGIKGLAFQGVGQSCSYYPDSSSSTNDKINVRQGRYEIWGPEHMVTLVDGSGKPQGVNSNTTAVQTLINALESTGQALGTQSDAGAGDGGVTSLGEAEVGQIITAISAPTAGFIPTCAMQVKRTAEIGAEASYAPPAACSCAFEIASGQAVTGHTCTACTAANAATTCTGATPACHFGYCEAE